MKAMKSLKKLSAITSEQFKDFKKVQPKQSLYKAKTRLEKIKQKHMIYPSSTDQRFVFRSNLDGAGFQRETYLNCPPTIPLDDMLHKINVACYKQWQKNREHNEKNPFAKLDLFTNIQIVIFLLLGVVLYILNQNRNDFISSFLYVFLVIIVTSAVMSLVAYSRSAQNYDPDMEMIRAIKRKLKDLNAEELQSSNGSPTFLWRYHKECLWICLKLIRTAERSVEDSQMLSQM